jgi:outer membrane protein assembly factor BamB
LEAFDKKSGEIVWETEVGGELLASVTSDSEKIFILTKPSATNNKFASIKEQNFTLNLQAISPKTGITNWQISLAMKEVAEKVYLFKSNRQHITILADNGHFFSLDIQTGRLLSKSKLGFSLSTDPYPFNNEILLATKEGKILILSITDSRVIDEIETQIIPNVILATEDKLLIGDKTGNVIAFDSKDKKRKWKATTGGQITSLSRVAKGILVSSFDNYVYLISEKSGKRIWRKRLSGRSIGAPLIKDNVAVFSTYGGTDSVFINLDKGKQINSISIQEENYFIDNPIGLGNSIIFPTFKGVLTYGTKKECASTK